MTAVYLLNQPKKKSDWKRQTHAHTQTYWDREECLKEGGSVKITRQEECN